MDRPPAHSRLDKHNYVKKPATFCHAEAWEQDENRFPEVEAVYPEMKT